MVAFKNSTGIKANSSFCTFRFPIAEAHQPTKPFQYQAITTALPTQPFAHFVFMPIHISHLVLLELPSLHDSRFEIFRSFNNTFFYIDTHFLPNSMATQSAHNEKVPANSICRHLDSKYRYVLSLFHTASNHCIEQQIGNGYNEHPIA